jgi:hypothetical protein
MFSDGSCVLILRDVFEDDQIDLLFTDASNCDVKVKIEGLDVRYVDGNLTNESDEDDLTYELVPKIQYRESFNVGLKGDSHVLKYTGLTSGGTINLNDYVVTQVSDINENDIILSATYKDCDGLKSQQFKDGLRNDDFTFTFNYQPIKIERKDCLGSVKKNVIIGETKIGTSETFEILPTTKIRVYTNKIIGEDGEVFKSKTYYFDERYPEELQVRVEKIEPCCDHTQDYYESGDYIITGNGNLIEVISVNLDYCTPDIYFNFNIEGNPLDLIVFNGNNNHQLLLQHSYDLFSRFNTNITQQLTSVCCLDGIPEGDRIVGTEYCDLDNNIQSSCGDDWPKPFDDLCVTCEITQST